MRKYKDRFDIQINTWLVLIFADKVRKKRTTEYQNVRQNKDRFGYNISIK